MSIKGFQLFLVRVFIGTEFIQHFAEKFGLLGWQAFDSVVSNFQSVGFSTVAMIIAGVWEFGAFAGFTLGLFTRLIAVGATLYFAILMYVGYQENLGVAWANSGGGWEHPAFWGLVCAMFVLTGAGRWSADAFLRIRLTRHRGWLGA